MNAKIIFLIGLAIALAACISGCIDGFIRNRTSEAIEMLICSLAILALMLIVVYALTQ